MRNEQVCVGLRINRMHSDTNMLFLVSLYMLRGNYCAVFGFIICYAAANMLFLVSLYMLRGGYCVVIFASINVGQL